MKKNNLYKIIEQMNNEDDSEILIHGELSQVPSEDLLSLLEKANDISLTTEEKTVGASAFRAFMEINTPANVPAESIESVKTSNVQKPKEKLKSLYTSWDILAMKASREASRALVFIKKNHMAYTAVVLLFAFLFTSSIAYASQDSIPGDILYPVKIHVHEKIESVLATKTEDKARVAVKHAVNRVKEAETLASEGKIDEENRASIDAAIEKDSSKAEASLAKLSDEGKADLAVQISSDYEDSLSIFAKNIENISAKESAQVAISINEKAVRVAKLATSMEKSNKADKVDNIEGAKNAEKSSVTKDIEIRLQKKLKALAEQRIALEAKLSASSTIVATKKNANSEQDSSKQKIENIEKYVKAPDANFTISANEIKEIKDKVEVAKNTYQEAAQKMNVGAYGNALTLFKNAKTNAEDAEKKLINSYKKKIPADSNTNPGNSYGATYVGSSKKQDGTTTVLLNVKPLNIVDLDAFGSSTQSNGVATSTTSITPVISTPAAAIPSVSVPAVSAPAVSVPGL